MSRIGKKPVVVPDKVKVSINSGEVKAEGPLGNMNYVLPKEVSAELKDGNILVTPTGSDLKRADAMSGTARTRIFNIVSGVSTGFSKTLEIQGLGYRAQVAGNKLNMELGFSHPVLIDIPPGIKMEVDQKQTILTIKGTDKVLIGDLAARIRRIRPPEPYKGSGIRYQGEHVARKAGKAAAGAGAEKK